MRKNQSLIKDLRFDTVNQAKLKDSRGKICLIIEKGCMYYGELVPNGTADGIADDDLFIETPVVDVFWKKQIGGDTAMPATGDPGVPADDVASVINPSVTFGDIQGKSSTEAIMALHFPPTVPVQQAPVLSRVVPAVLTIEKGDALAAVELLFTQNQGGAVSGNYTLNINGTGAIEQAGNVFDIAVNADAQTVIAPLSMVCTVPYDAGQVPNDTYGNPVPGSQIQAGVASLNFTVTPVVHTYHGTRLKGDGLTGMTSTELRGTMDLMAMVNGTSLYFSNVTAPHTSDYYILVPGTFTTVTTIAQGFTISGIGTIEGQFEVDDRFGTETSTYTIVKLAGQAGDSVIDTVTIS